MGAKKKDPLLGQKVGNYKIKSQLGKGGMASVYLAENPIIGREVAIKVLARHLAEQETVASRFISEARAVTRLKHPAIIEIYDFGALEDETPYYVMEKLSGRELKDVMKARGKMPAGEVLPLLEQICGGLQAAHDGGVVHRDLKPANIFVLDGEPAQVKLLDFGIAKMLEGEDAAMQTATGVVIGTPHFISPEQAAGKRDLIGPATDIYSLGLIIYWMLCGELPFSEDSVGMLLVKHISEAPPPLQERAPEVCSAVAEVVHRCLMKEPDKRPGTPTELLKEFRAAAEEAAVEEAAVADAPPAETAPEEPGSTSVDLPGGDTRMDPAPEDAEEGEAGEAEAPSGEGTQILGRDMEPTSASPAVVEETTVGSLSEIFESPPEVLKPPEEIPFADKPATEMTTMGGATGEVNTKTDEGKQKKPMVWLGIAAAVLALVGGGIFMASRDSAEPDAAPQMVAAESPSHGMAPPVEPEPEPVEKPEPEKATPTHTLTVSVQGVEASCSLAVGQEAAAVAVREMTSPCTFKLPQGQEGRLKVAAPGVSAFERPWTAGEDLKIKLALSPDRKRLITHDELKKLEQAARAAEASKPMAARAPAPRKKAAVKKKPRPRIKPPPAPKPVAAPTPPKPRPKKPQKAGEDVVDIEL